MLLGELNARFAPENMAFVFTCPNKDCNNYFQSLNADDFIGHNYTTAVITESEGDVAGEMECEMQARDFFSHIGMLILEGRTPEHSFKGRVEGPHCLSLFSVLPHVCDPSVEYGCQIACERKEKMAVLWQNSSPMVITVKTQLPDDKNWILLERWTVEAVDGIDYMYGSSGSMLIQAIRSHIHFSQLSAWLSRSKGAVPSQIFYRICAIEEDSTSDSFLKEPDFHAFPLANLHSNRLLRVSVHSLPRCDIFNFTDEILSSKLNQLYPGPYSKKENEDLECVDESARSPLKKRSCINQLDADHEVQTLNGKNCSNKQSILEFSKPSTSRTLDEQEETRNCERNLLNNASKIKGGFLKICSLSVGTHGNTLHGQTNQDSDFSKQYHQSTSTPTDKKQSVLECKKSADLSQPLSSKILIPHGVLLCGCHVGTGTLPIFNSRTGLPVSSSPAPLRRSATDLDIEDNREVANGVTCEKSSSRDLTAILSKSAPASTTQSLLGNFEESLLNGRMEPLGTVEGFTAELGASGSFCPAHVTLPVKAYFFSLSDDNAPSPYLGYISLNNPSISRKGYHVPTKGTVQLTLFNPNKTVVKMFVVLYNFNDMPPKAQTFLRQRTFSVWKQACHSEEDQNSLHYLIHLRFVTSKSGRVYLHTDIRVIFARQPPDLPSGVTFCTVTDGPTEPRYTLS